MRLARGTMMSKTPKTPEEALANSERWRQREVEALETAAGAAVGAMAGALAGPIGMAAGAAIGAAVGAIASVQTQRVDHAEAEHDKDLDAIGTNSARGRAMKAETAADAAREREDEIARSLQAEAIEDEQTSGPRKSV